ncbi:hypothetical protein BLNAU_4059 [Blattamonas nauphoetae]|uniref:Uncharacterized protein n=1 Tax=Blattamonas nauphoetae TaxID=2049346 RepID=A0ABQ9YB21_9EUKA|nr:hypothetical protein BLNAU_4059 [Blattamonas nauphoetae]
MTDTLRPLQSLRDELQSIRDRLSVSDSVTMSVQEDLLVGFLTEHHSVFQDFWRYLPWMPLLSCWRVISKLKDHLTAETTAEEADCLHRFVERTSDFIVRHLPPSESHNPNSLFYEKEFPKHPILPSDIDKLAIFLLSFLSDQVAALPENWSSRFSEIPRSPEAFLRSLFTNPFAHLLCHSLSREPQISGLARPLLKQVIRLHDDNLSILLSSLDQTTVTEDLRNIRSMPSLDTTIQMRCYLDVQNLVNFIRTTVQFSTEESQMTSSKILLSLAYQLQIPLDYKYLLRSTQFLPITLFGRLMEEVLPSSYPSLIRAYLNAFQNPYLRMPFSPDVCRRFLEHIDVVSSPDGPKKLYHLTKLLAFSTRRDLWFDFHTIIQSGAQPQAMRAAVVFAELMYFGQLSDSPSPKDLSILCWGLTHSPDVHTASNFIFPIYLNLHRLLESNLSVDEVPPLIEAVLKFETQVADCLAASPNTEYHWTKRKPYRFFAFAIIAALLTSLDKSSFRSSYFGSMAAGDTETWYTPKEKFSATSPNDIDFPLFYSIDGVAPHKPLSFPDPDPFSPPTSYPEQIVAPLITLAEQIIMRLSSYKADLLSDAQLRVQPAVDLLVLNPPNRVYDIFLQLSCCLAVLIPSVDAIELSKLVEPFYFAEEKSIFSLAHQFFKILARRLNQTDAQFFASTQVHPFAQQPPRWSWDKQLPKISGVCPAISLFKAYVFRRAQADKYDRTDLTLYKTDLTFLTNRFIGAVFLMEFESEKYKVCSEATLAKICVPSTPIVVPNSFFLPFSRLLRQTRALELSGTSKTLQRDLIHVHVVRLARVVELVYLMLDERGDTDQDEKTRQGMSQILANELLASLLLFPTLQSNQVTVSLPLPTRPMLIYGDQVDPKHVTMWNTSLKEEGLDDFLCCFFNDGVQPCAKFCGFNCRLPVSPVLTLERHDVYRRLLKGC